ncbi:MAG TPA: HAMP domain-containing sensor histidine kinase [Candidatus Limnocylindrales bacterium]|nr:HAMP domain-containing sensor histidine kinase [Candidatus Limnocylindrales bacterium]
MKDGNVAQVGHAACSDAPDAIAHDLRNLLMSVDSNVAIVRDLLTPGHAAHPSLDAIAAASRTLTALVGRLASPAASSLTALTDVGVVLDGIRGSLDGVVGGRARLSVSRPSVPALVGVDPVSLERIVLNLVANAAEAVAPGGSIDVAARVVAGPAESEPDRRRSVELTVLDDGPGVPAAIAERIFDAGFSTKHGPHAGHAGLGLATVRAIVEAHGGTVAVRARRDGGSGFVVRLPAVRGRRAADGTADASSTDPRLMTAAG